MNKQNTSFPDNLVKTDQIPASPVDKQYEKTKINYWMYSTFVLIILLFISLFSKIEISGNVGKNTTVATTSSPTPTIIQEQMKIKTETVVPEKGKSYGVFYPFSQGATINNNLPVVIGKVEQDADIYLNTSFGLEKSPVSFENEYFLRFLPGRVKGLRVKIDGVEIGNVFGTPQYPTVLCKTTNLNPDGTSSYDSQTGMKSPPDDIFKTEGECLKHKMNEFPPILFFAKITKPLADGPHKLTLEGKNLFKEMTFTVNSNYHLSSQDVFISDNDSNKYYKSQHLLFITDNCSPGYYYDTNYLKIPLPTFNNPDLFYEITFPRSKDDLGNTKENRVQISFEGTKFDLFFPQSLVYFEGRSLSDRNNYLSPYHQLYLPLDHLVYTNDRKVTRDENILAPREIFQSSGYLEILPVDISGGRYIDSSIPFVISGTSSCDG